MQSKIEVDNHRASWRTAFLPPSEWVAWKFQSRVTFIFVLAICVMMFLPVITLRVISWRPGIEGAWLVILMAVSFGLAWLISAYGRVRFEALSFPWISALTVMSIAVFVGSKGGLDDAVSALSSSGGTLIKAAFGFWLLMLGYAFKSLFDAARDKLAKVLTQRLPPWL